MKRLTALLLAICSVLVFGACSSCDEEKSSTSTPQNGASEEEIWTPNY